MFRIVTGMKCALLVSVLSLVGFSQTKASLSFEVASIKPSPPIDPVAVASGKPLHAGMKIDASRVDIGNFSIAALVAKAYDVKQYQISGPEWVTALSAQRFDVLAKMPEGATKEQVPEMLQTMLAERFKLKIHREMKDTSIYALVVAKAGPKMKEAEALPAAPTMAADGSPAPPPSSGSSQMTVNASAKGAEVTDGQGVKQRMIPSPDGKSMRFEYSRISMAQFAEGLAPLVDRPIVDMTDLKGFYQASVEISMEDLMAIARKAGANIPARGGDAGRGGPAEAAADPSAGSIFTSMQQLGLKLEPRKAPLDHIVVDSVEKMPTEN